MILLASEWPPISQIRFQGHIYLQFPFLLGIPDNVKSTGVVSHGNRRGPLGSHQALRGVNNVHPVAIPCAEELGQYRLTCFNNKFMKRTASDQKSNPIRGLFLSELRAPPVHPLAPLLEIEL